MVENEERRVHAEIEYCNSEGVMIHSDICPPEHLAKYLNYVGEDLNYRELLHELLDEWLDNSNGTGIFYIAEEGYRL